MKLSVKDMDIATGGVLIAILNQEDAEMYDFHPNDRVCITKGKRSVVAAIDIAESEKAVPKGRVGMFEETLDKLAVVDGENVELVFDKKPESVRFIKKKLNGKELAPAEIKMIIDDLVAGKLTTIELTYYVAANYTQGMSTKETVALTKAMVNTGDRLTFPKKKYVVDKHCIGGVAGNRTTMVVVPILAAAGLFVPKTSSRSITSPAGTADTMEVLCDVCMPIDEIKLVLKKVGACMTWGGAVNLAPADDIIIGVEHPLSVDPEGQLLASILAKKASVGSTHVFIDIPVGKGAKINSAKEAMHLRERFITIGKALGLKVVVMITDGSQPIGNGIGPALEARDVMWVLKNHPNQPWDLREKSIEISAVIFEATGVSKKGKGREDVEYILHSGKAYSKMWDIIEAQGAKVRTLEDLNFGDETFNVKATKSGKIIHIDNKSISKVARIAGCPKDTGAGIFMYKHVGDKVAKGDVLFKIYSQSKEKLKFAKDMWDKIDGVKIR